MESQAKIVLDEAEMPIFRVFQPAVDVNKQKKFIAYQGAQSTVWQHIPATSPSINLLAWNLNTPSVRVGINRQAFVKIKIKATAYNNTNPPTAVVDAQINQLWGSGRYGLRLFPLQSSADTASLDLNSSRFSWNPRSILSAMYAYNIPQPVQDGLYSVAGGVPDKFSTYAVTTTDADYSIVPTSVRHPLAIYASSRNATRNLQMFDLIPEGGNSGKFTVEWYEPLIIPPMATEASEKPCLYGINNFNLTFIISDPTRMFSICQNDDAVETALPQSIVFDEGDGIVSAELHLQYHSFNLTYPLPRTPVWSCSDIIMFRSNLTSPIPEPIATIGIAGFRTFNAPSSNSTNSVNLNQIPKTIMVFAKRASGSDNAALPDTWLRIAGLSADFNARSGLLASCDEHDLYAISKKNGLTMQYQEVQQCGIPVVLSPAEDMSLNDDQAPGLIGQFNLQFTRIDYRQPLSYPLARAALTANGKIRQYSVNNAAWQTIVVCVNEGACWLGADGILKSKFGMLTENAILSAPIEFGTYEGYSADTLIGGSWFDKVKSIVNKGAKFIKGALPHVSNFAAALAPAASQYLPEKYGAVAKGLEFVGKNGRKANTALDTIQAATGGTKYVSRSALKKKLHHHK